MISNLKRLFEVDKITTEGQFQLQRDFFYKDIVTLNITILDITSEDVIRAEDLNIEKIYEADGQHSACNCPEYEKR